MPHVDLLELPYFDGISIDDLVSLVDLMEPRYFRANDVIIEEGSAKPPPLYIATTGRVLISKANQEKKERPLAELDSPTLFGEIELFCQIGSVATARALTRVDAFLLTRPNFERLFQAHHPAIIQFTFNVARVACHRLAVADEIMARTIGGEDLVKIRRAVFARMRDQNQWDKVTGVFKRPK